MINIPREVSVPDQVVWSLSNLLFLNGYCLGFTVEFKDRKKVDDVTGAQAYASTGKYQNVSSPIVTSLWSSSASLLSPPPLWQSLKPFFRGYNILDSSPVPCSSPQLALPSYWGLDPLHFTHANVIFTDLWIYTGFSKVGVVAKNNTTQNKKQSKTESFSPTFPSLHQKPSIVERFTSASLSKLLGCYFGGPGKGCHRSLLCPS